jgi:SNF2 family DNA or RNA helicase
MVVRDLVINQIDEILRADELAHQQDIPEASGLLEPRDYQWKGIRWLQQMRRAMLTDKAGLGKTLQAAMAAETPCLISAPTYLTRQWYNFIRKQFPNDPVRICRGSRKKRTKALNTAAKWIIINHQMLRSYEIPTRFRTLIFDESHHLRNHKALQSKSAAKLCARDMTVRVYELSASPIWKNVDDLWNQLHMLQPDLFPAYDQFVRYWCTTDEDAYGGLKVYQIKKHLRKELEELLDIIRLGRTYADVGRVLPPVITHNIDIDFPDDLRAQYKLVKDHYRLELGDDEQLIFTSYAAVMHTLRQLTAFPDKMDAVVNIACDTLIQPEYDLITGEKNKPPAPMVVFTWYRDSAHTLGKKLSECPDLKGKKVQVITGEVPYDKRAELAMEADIVVANISALSEGCNLYHMRTVVFFEENWPPGSNYQAMSRVIRDRNDDGADIDPVNLYFVHVPNTIDTIIHRVTKLREASIRDVMKEILE